MLEALAHAPEGPFAFDGAPDLLRAWRAGLTPDPDLTVSAWADRHRILSPRGANEAGPWRTSRTPYLQELMDALSPRHPAQRVVFMKGSQLGASESGCNWIGYVIHHAPGPMLAVQPSVELAKRFSQQRIDPLIEESPALREKVAPARSRDSGNTVLSKEFPGGILVLTGANSAVGLRSMPVRYLFPCSNPFGRAAPEPGRRCTTFWAACTFRANGWDHPLAPVHADEVDAYPPSADDEGDPVALAEARTRTFSWRRKVFLASTPTIKGLSRIEREYEASDQRRFFVPCPHCGHPQALKFERLRWQKGEPETAAYVCEACERPIAEHHKTRMLSQGQWRPTATPADPLSIGFHLSSLYSPVGWLSWERIAREWEACQSSIEAKRSFINTVLGETWAETGEAPDWLRLYERRSDDRVGTVPAGGLFLTAGADVQKDRIEVSIWAWGRGLESWLVDHVIIDGGPGDAATWAQLSDLLGETWPHASGVRLGLARLGIDTGYEAAAVYAWARRQGFAQVLPLKGAEGFNRSAPVSGPTHVDATEGGVKIRRGARLWTVAVATFKSETYAYLSNDMIKANYSNARLALLEFRRRTEAYQHAVMVWQLCRRVWARWMDTAVLAGALDIPGYEANRRGTQACAWLPPKWDWVDPLKDAKAEIEQIAAGLKSRTQALAERGFDAEQVDAEIAADQAREQALGLSFGATASTPDASIVVDDEDTAAPEQSTVTTA